MLNHRHKPKSGKHMIGRDAEIKRLLECIEKKIPVILCGGTGSGKTCSVYAMANENNYEILETNASDLRSREEIEAKVGNSSRQASLFSKKRILLIDEIDGMAGREDAGGMQSINEIISNSMHPIVLTTNNVWDPKLKGIRKKCVVIELKKLNYAQVFEILKKITDTEKISVDDLTLKMIARRCDGDVRSAINDLEILVHGGEAGELDYREKSETIFNVLKLIFKGKEVNSTLDAFDALDENFSEIIMWLDENLPKEYSGKELADAYDYLSLADVYGRRIYKRQYYRYMVYQKLFMALGIALSKTHKRDGFINYTRSVRPLKIWIAKRKNAERLAMAQEVSERTNMSVKKAIQELPYMKFLNTQTHKNL